MPINLTDVELPFHDIEVTPTPEGSVVRIYLTYSNTSSFQACRWKYWARQLRHLTPAIKKTVFKLGHAYHNGVEHYYDNAGSKLDDETLVQTHFKIDQEMTGEDGEFDLINAVKVKSMVKGFIQRFADSPYKLIEQERPFCVKMEDAPDFEMNGIKYEFWIAGKIDGIMNHKLNGKLYLGEWKTTVNFQDFISKIKQDNQPWHYMLGNYLETGDLPDGVVYRLAKKTLIRQKKSETEADFCNRIVETYENNINDHFHEEIIYADPARLDRHIDYLNMIALDIAHAFKNELWYRNRGSCFAYNSPCPYMTLCNTYNETDFNQIASMHYNVEVPNSELGQEIADAAGES